MMILRLRHYWKFLLTTVRQPIDAIGQKATEVINQLVNSEENIEVVKSLF